MSLQISLYMRSLSLSCETSRNLVVEVKFECANIGGGGDGTRNKGAIEN